MGSKSSKRPKTLEPYNSFETLPTSNEFFNRQLLQQIDQQQQQQYQAAPPQPQGIYGTLSFHNQFAPQSQFAGFNTNGFQQGARLALPHYTHHHNHQLQPHMSPYGGPRLQVGYLAQSHQSLSLGRNSDNLSRRQFSMYPSSSAASPQIIQSVPKFNQHGPIVKF
jgi:hypothetical protein